MSNKQAGHVQAVLCPPLGREQLEDVSIIQWIISFVTVSIEYLITFFIVGGAVVTFWRATWVLLDLLLFPSDSLDPADPNRMCSALACLAIGAAIFLVCGALQGVLEPKARAGASERTWLGAIGVGAADRLWSYVLAVASVFAWRGMWLLWNSIVIPVHPFASAAFAHVLGAGVAMSLWSSRSLLAPPMAFVADDAPGAFTFPRWGGFSRLLAGCSRGRCSYTAPRRPLPHLFDEPPVPSGHSETPLWNKLDGVSTPASPLSQAAGNLPSEAECRRPYREIGICPM
jgi:hypothetical protein